MCIKSALVLHEKFHTYSSRTQFNKHKKAHVSQRRNAFCTFCPLPHKLPTVYTGCNRRNGPEFGRVFLMLNYTEKPQNTYIQSLTVWEIMAIENCGLPSGPRTIAVSWDSYLLVGQQQAGVLRHHSTFQYDV